MVIELHARVSMSEQMTVDPTGVSDGGQSIDDGTGGRVDVFDFRRPDRIPKSQIRAIYLLNESFVRTAVSSLSAYLRTYLSIRVAGVTQSSYSEFLGQVPATTCLVCLGIKPYEGCAVLEINPALVFPILEILLGGSGKVPTNIERELTEIEQTLLDGFFRILVNDLTEAWKSVTPIDFQIQSVHTEPQLLQVMAPNEAVVAVKLEMRIGESTGHLNIAMPSLMIKLMRQKFDHQRVIRKSASTEEEQRSVLDLIQASRIEIDVRLLEQQIKAKDLLSLKPGDVLTFDLPADQPVEIVLNGRRQFQGNVVDLGRKRGFCIDGPLGSLVLHPTARP